MRISINPINLVFQAKKAQVQKPKSRVDYSQEFLNEAVAKNETEAFILKKIPNLISNIEEYIAQYPDEFSQFDKEDLIQDVILACLDRVYSIDCTKNNHSRHAQLVNYRNLQIKRTHDSMREHRMLPLDNSICVSSDIEDDVAKLHGKSSMEKLINNVLIRLEEDERNAIIDLYGIETGTPITHEQHALKSGVSIQRVGQRKESALKHLRSYNKFDRYTDRIYVSSNGTIYTLEQPQQRRKN